MMYINKHVVYLQFNIRANALEIGRNEELNGRAVSALGDRGS
jgi:hypothetical protein